jgi:hypothetical protein
MSDAGCRMPDAGCRMPDAGCRMENKSGKVVKSRSSISSTANKIEPFGIQ